MWLQGVGTRRRPCASRHGTHDGAPCLGAGALEEALEEATTEKNEPPTHGEGGGSVSSPYIRMGSYISLL